MLVRPWLSGDRPGSQWTGARHQSIICQAEYKKGRICVLHEPGLVYIGGSIGSASRESSKNVDNSIYFIDDA